ncbi:MAG: sugar transferase [Muribaculaceae bacterium]
MISVNKQRLKYIIGDYVSSNIAWCLFNVIRYYFIGNIINIQGYKTLNTFLCSPNVMLGQLFFPMAMMFVYYLSGYYNQVFTKSRLQEFSTTVISSFINALLLFFTALINDLFVERIFNYELILMLWGILFVMVYTVRYMITDVASRKIHNREWKFDTLIIGNSCQARAFESQLSSMDRSLGYNIVGYVNIPKENAVKESHLPVYELDELAEVCEAQKIKELLIVPSKSNAGILFNVVNKLFPLNLPIKISPDMFNILVTRVKISNICGEPLVDISGASMSASSINLKRTLDVVMSIFAMIILSPIYILLALMIKIDSSGAIIYKQERVGYHNAIFNIYKFRTMIKNAEESGCPLLSSENDDRVTYLGRFLRKYRLDELPQFWNVLKGDMSLVGPRPERQYYIDQIIKEAPYYTLLHQVRPGITSMGMVKYGYACNVSEMIKRLRYDLIYIENMSLMNDMKIMIYTVKTVITGKGL